VNQALVGKFAQDSGDCAVSAAVLLGELRGGGQRIARRPFPGRQPAPQVLLDALRGALGVPWHSVSFARQDHLYPLDSVNYLDSPAAPGADLYAGIARTPPHACASTTRLGVLIG
jgi:hypothetical protein